MAYNGPDATLKLREALHGYGRDIEVTVTCEGETFGVKVDTPVEGQDTRVHALDAYWEPGKGLYSQTWNLPGLVPTVIQDVEDMVTRMIRDAYAIGRMGPKEFHTYDWREVFSFCSSPDPIPGYQGSHAGFSMFDVQDVIASSEGENDGSNWLAAVKLKDGRFAFVSAGCDYTGFD